MRVEARDGSKERRILTGMIVNGTVLNKVSQQWKGSEKGLFRNDWCNLIGKWCVSYWEKYGRAPKRQIEPLFEAWSEKAQDKDTIAVVEKFLSGLSTEYSRLAKETNPEYVLDLCGDHFTAVRLQQLTDRIQGLVDSGEVSKAAEIAAGFDRVSMGKDAPCDVFQDMGSIKQAFEEKDDPFIMYPGPLGEFFGSVFERDALVAFMGPEKRGKSWILQDIAWMGALSQRRVAYFSVGDMSKSQVLYRLACRAARKPTKPKKYRIPTSIFRDPDDSTLLVEYKDREMTEKLTWEQAWEAFGKVQEKKIGASRSDSYLRLSCHPNSTLSVKGVQGMLTEWDRDGWEADVVVIDYADVLSPMGNFKESRDSINETWKSLRSLSQARHGLVVTATQSDAASYDVQTITRKNFTDDKRKLAHVTAMYGINCTPEEKDLQVLRLNPIVLREEEYQESKCVYTVGCLSIGSPFMLSTF